MRTDWLKVLIAAVFEVCWVIGLKHADDFWSWVGTAVAIFVSFYLMIIAGRKLPVGTVYAVFVGLGTAGTVLAEIILFVEPFKFGKIALIVVILSGVTGLKLLSSQPEKEGEKA